MLETKEQKKYLGIIGLLVVALLSISVFNTGSFRYVDKTDYKKQQELNRQQQLAYDNYLKSIHIDYAASKELYEQIISEEDVKKEIQSDLQVDQAIKQPEIDLTKLNVKGAGEAAVVNYFQKDLAQVNQLKNKTSGEVDNLFVENSGAEATNNLLNQTQIAYGKLAALQVPKEALDFHVAQLIAMQGYIAIIENSQKYSDDSSYNPWPKLYHDYSVISQQVAVMNQSFDALNNKYALNDRLYAAALHENNDWLFKTAHASIPVINIEQVARQIYEEALATAFARFALAFLDKLISKIQTNYQIANFLYYTDAVVSGQYVDDYLNKYVNSGSSLDKAMIKNFIPQLNCGTPANITNILKAKSSQYLGFDPAAVSLNDPDYYTKMAKVGDFLSSPTGWEVYYNDVAKLTQSQAENAAQQELFSQGLKSSRDYANKGQIATAGVNILATLHAAFQSYLNLGSQNSRSVVSKIVSGVVQTVFNKFLFKGAVLKEQQVCLSAAQISPVLPVSGSEDSENVPPVPNPSQIENQYY